MKFKLRLSLPVLFGVIGFASMSAPVQAQWQVTDPGSYVFFGHIWESDLSNGIKIETTIQQGVTMISQGLKLYNLAMQETTALRNKNFMQAAGVLAQLGPIPGNQDLTNVLRSATGAMAAAGVWQRITAPGGTLAARIQMADSFAISTMNSLGSCNASAIDTDSAIGQFEHFAISMDTFDNTHAALAGGTNMGIDQQLRIQECQHNLQQQELQLRLLELHRQRDYENAQQTSVQSVTSIASSNPQGLTNVGDMFIADFN